MENREITKIQWHPAFAAAFCLELAEDRDSLIFEREHSLNIGPLEIDLLITKKFPGRPLANEIGQMFRGHNILEYKDPSDSLNIDVFFKVTGYACLYKAYGETVDAILEADITITFIRDAKPYGLLRYFKEHGYHVSNPYSGIYYIKGNIPFPAQILVTKELEPGLHAWLRSLSGRLEKQELESLLARIRSLKAKKDREFAEAVLEVVLRANMKTMEELAGDDKMSEELLEIIRPIVEPRILLMRQEALDTGLKQGIEQGIEQGVKQGIEQGVKQGIEQGVKQGIEQGIRGAVEILRSIGHTDETIKGMIMEKYKLSETDAEQYLQPDTASR